MKKLISRDICWDWKSSPSLEDLRKALAPLGVTVTEHPACEGSDTFGYIFSNRPLTKEELDEAASQA